MSYFPDISWSTRVSNVTYHSPYRFTVLAEPLDLNDKGFGVVEVGDWLIDNAGYPFLIENVSGYVLRCYDVNERGNGTLSAYAPYDGRLAYVYRPKNGAFMLTQAQLRKLDKSAPDIINPIEKGVIWAYRGLEIGGEYDGVSGANDNITRINFTDFFPLSTEDEGWQGGKAYTLDLDVTKIDHDLLFNISGAGTIHLDQDQVDALWVKDGANIFRNSDVGVGGSPLDKFHVTTGHSRFNSLTSAVTGVVRANTDGRIAKIDYENDVNKFLASDGLWRTIVTSSGDFLDSVIGMQEDATLSPTLVAGARYIILDAANLHANFGTITGVANNDIVEYNGTDWVVVFDASEALQPATVTVGTDVNNNDNHQWTYNVSTATWVDRGAIADHNSLTGLQGGINGQKYHFSEEQHTDLLEVIGGGDISDTYHSHDARYVEVAGDAMTGDLSVNANFTTTGLTTLNTSLGGVAYLTEGVVGAVDFSDLAYFPSDEGLQGYWSFNEPVGTLAYDQSGNANDGTLVGGVTRVAGKVGNALEFGDNARVLIPSNPSLTAAKDGDVMTLCAWWQPYALGNSGTLFSLYANASNRFRVRTLNATELRFNGVWDGVSFADELAVTLSTTELSHIVWIIEGTLNTLYVNNVLIGTFNTTSNLSGILGNLGMHIGNFLTTEEASGIIDEPRIYSRALTQAEITALYTQKVAKNKDYFHEQMKIGTTAITSGYNFDVDANARVGGNMAIVGTTTLATSLTGLLKSTAGVVSTAVADTDYVYTPYSLPLAADGTRGGVQIGYTATGANVPLLLSSEKAYVALTKSAVESVLTGDSITTHYHDSRYYTQTQLGTGTATRIPFWTGADTMGNSANLVWDDNLKVRNDATIRFDRSVSGLTGIEWWGTDSSQTAFKAAIRNIDSATFRRTGLGFYTSDAADWTTEAELRMSILRNGNVLIGTTADSGHKLNVNGSAQVTGLKVGTLTGLLQGDSGTVGTASILISVEEPNTTGKIDGDIWVES